MTYAEKLRDPRWQRKRLEILQRDNWTCVVCGSTDKELQVHHVVYAKTDPWDYSNFVLQTLCKQCHEVRQEISDRAANALRICIKDVPTPRMEKVANRICEEAMEAIES